MTTERFQPDEYGSAHAEVPGRFRFHVEVVTHRRGWALEVNGDDELHELEQPVYRVSLPHQCDQWEITLGADPCSKDEARECLTRFIAEATDALAVLEKAP